MDRERKEQIESGMYNMGDSWVHKALRDCMDTIETQERRIEELEANEAWMLKTLRQRERSAKKLSEFLRATARTLFSERREMPEVLELRPISERRVNAKIGNREIARFRYIED